MWDKFQMHNFLLYKLVSHIFLISPTVKALQLLKVSKVCLKRFFFFFFFFFFGSSGPHCSVGPLDVYRNCYAYRSLQDLLNARNCNFLLFLVRDTTLHACVISSFEGYTEKRAGHPVHAEDYVSVYIYIYIYQGKPVDSPQESHAYVLMSLSKGEWSVNQFYFIQAAMHGLSYSFEG